MLSARAAGTAHVNRRRRGGMLINVILGLVLLAGLLATAYSVYQSGHERAAISRLQTRLNLVKFEIARLYRSAPDYAGLTVGTYDSGTDTYSGGVAGQSHLAADKFENFSLVAADAGTGYCLDVHALPASLCRKASRALDMGSSFSLHHSRCSDSPTVLRICKRAYLD